MEKIKTWDLNKDFPAEVNAYDTSDKIVMRGTINIHLSMKRI